MKGDINDVAVRWAYWIIGIAAIALVAGAIFVGHVL